MLWIYFSLSLHQICLHLFYISTQTRSNPSKPHVEESTNIQTTSICTSNILVRGLEKKRTTKPSNGGTELVRRQYINLYLRDNRQHVGSKCQPPGVKGWLNMIQTSIQRDNQTRISHNHVYIENSLHPGLSHKTLQKTSRSSSKLLFSNKTPSSFFSWQIT